MLCVCYRPPPPILGNIWEIFQDYLDSVKQSGNVIFIIIVGLNADPGWFMSWMQFTKAHSIISKNKYFMPFSALIFNKEGNPLN